MSPAATWARIRVDETVSPSTSTSGTTRVSNSGWAGASPGRLSPWRRSGSSRRPRHCSAPSALDQDPLDELLGRAGRTRLSNRITTSSRDAQAFDHVALDRERHDQLRQRRRVEDLERVRLEGEDGVGALDHLPVADVDAVEGADRDLARPGLGVGQRGDLDAHRSASATAGRALAHRDRRLARRRPRRRRANRGPAQRPRSRRRRARDQAAHVGARPSTRSRTRRLPSPRRAARPGGPRPRARGLDLLTAAGPLVGRSPPTFTAEASVGAGGSCRSAAPARRATSPVSVISPSGSPVVETPPTGRLPVGLRQARHEALHASRPAEQDDSSPVAKGSSVPAWPALHAGSRRAWATTSGRSSRPACRRAARPPASAAPSSPRAERRPRRGRSDELVELRSVPESGGALVPSPALLAGDHRDVDGASVERRLTLRAARPPSRVADHGGHAGALEGAHVVDDALGHLLAGAGLLVVVGADVGDGEAVFEWRWILSSARATSAFSSGTRS